MKTIDILLEITLYSGILFSAIMLLKLCFRNRISPFLHFAVWGLLIARLLIPVTVESSVHLFVLPDAAQPEAAVRQEQPPASQPGALLAADAAGAPIARRQAQAAALQGGTDGSSSAVPTSRSAVPSIGDILLTVWLSGAGMGLIYLALLHHVLRRRIRRNAAAPSRKLLALFEEVERELGLKAGPRLVCQYEYGTPALLFPRTVLMPLGMLAAMDDEQVKCALRHELTHFKRGDHGVNLLLSVLNAVYWFNPVVWLALPMIRADMETACDSAVVRGMNEAQRCRYASLVVSLFARPAHRQLALGMAQGATKKLAERRVRGIFMRSRSGKGVRLASALFAAVLLVACFTTACQPSPSKPIVINKGDGRLEQIIQGTPAPVVTTKSDQIPTKLQYDLDGGESFKVHVDADVSVPDAEAYPVMSTQRDTITQEQADAIMAALLKGQTLYRPTTEQDKSQIQVQIDYYTHELKAADTDYLKKTYQGYLKELMQDYKKAPDSLPMEPASTRLEFNEDYPDVIYYYDRDGVWSDELRRKAQADGWKGIYGVTAHVPGQRQMLLGIRVNGDNTQNEVFFEQFDNYGHVVDALPTGIDTLSQEQAVSQGKELLAQMGLEDFSLTSAEATMQKQDKCYALVFKRNINGISQGDVSSAHLLGMPEYAPPFVDESVGLSLNDSGIVSFYWNGPSKFVATENTNVPLLSFDQAEDIFRRQIVLQNRWSQPDKHVVARRIEIDHVQLSYMPIQRANDAKTYLYVPVWDFCGRMIDKYSEEYEKDVPDHLRLDENNEYTVIGGPNYSGKPVSFLTVNAIDGSVIDRNRGY